ncbi:energy coupling factor transporter S component ThiW [Syntrophobotulus glycolicus]|uniref:energy coupling factor transporter S component ThiW n=1 Tax=Syntrophobotulus glycolicus TaxID=51197 RepID=UPI003D0399CB
MHKISNKFIFALVGEVIGTGVISAIISVPVMKAFYGLAPETPFYFYIPFFTPSSAMGGTLGVLLLIALKKAKVLNKIKAWDNKKEKSDSLSS